MKALDFLGRILPAAGPYCIVTIKDGKVNQFFADTLEELPKIIKPQLKAHHDIYFSPASYHSKQNRKADNTASMKSFWLDLDCGEGKPFVDKAEARAALDTFVLDSHLSNPNIVDSGNGLHIYWTLTSTLPSDKWELMARRLKAACTEFGFEADPAVTADRARILRVPDTYNFKDKSNPKTVTMVRTEPAVDTKAFVSALQLIELKEAEVLPIRKGGARKMSDTSRALQGNYLSRFSSIVRKSMKGDGCEHIKRMLLHPADVTEPLWRAGLSIAKACEIDGEKAIHKLSQSHPEYTPSSTTKKAHGITGPYTCRVFAELDPEPCEGCKVKFKSPIGLGQELNKASAPTDEELFVASQTPAEDLPKDKPAVFKPPYPYVRGKKGGVYLETDDGEGNKELKLVYRHDIYPVCRTYNEVDGEYVIVRIHSPTDAVREFSISLSHVSDPNKLKSVLSKHGAAIVSINPMVNYMIAFVEELKRLNKAQIAREHYGWCDEQNTFVLGLTEYTKKGPRPSAASNATEDSVEYFKPQGSIERWREAIDIYNEPGMEPLAFAFLAGFGSPLMPYSGVAGITVDMMSTESGTGKTTAEKAALSIYGNPQRLMLNSGDTYNSRMHRLGVMRNLPVAIDEMTNTDAKEVSDMLYGITQGREKNRMKGDVNQERKNNTEWSLIALTSGNASMMSKVSAHSSAPDGEAARLMEFHVEPVPLAGAAEKFAYLDKNFGHAGKIYVEWLARNEGKLAELVDKARLRLVSKARASNVERFWTGGGGATFAGAHIAKELGLHNLDIERIEDWLVEFFDYARENLKQHKMESSEAIDEFLAENNGRIFVYDKGKKSTVSDVIMDKYINVHGAIVGRYEVASKKLFIVTSAFNKFCHERRLVPADIIKSLKYPSGDLVYLKSDRKRLLVGSSGSTAGPNLNAMWFDCSTRYAATLEEEAQNPLHLVK